MKASALLSLLLLLGPACTAKNPAYEKQLAQLDENIVILKSERDRLEERIAVLEAEREVAVRERPPQTGALQRPPLKVVQLAPPSPAEPADVDGAGASNAPELTAAAASQDNQERVLIQGSGQDIQQLPGQP